MLDVITCANFGVNKLRGLGKTRGQILEFPIEMAGHPYNRTGATAQPVIYWHTSTEPIVNKNFTGDSRVLCCCTHRLEISACDNNNDNFIALRNKRAQDMISRCLAPWRLLSRAKLFIHCCMHATLYPFTRLSKRRANIKQTSSRPDGTPPLAQM